MSNRPKTWAAGAGIVLVGLSACHAPLSIEHSAVLYEIAAPAPTYEQSGAAEEGAEDPHEDRAHGGPSHSHDAPPAMLGFDLVTGWLDPWVHRHFSPRGTPYVHTFGVEPAFIDRDLFIDVGFATGSSGDVTELVTELEWGLTRRLGLVLEVPHAWTAPDDAQDESGLGDIAIAPRALLVETDRFLASANLEVALPTGDDARGLGTGETAIAPSLSLWFDLGRSVQANTQIGVETGLRTGNDELFYGVAGSWTFAGPTPFDRSSSAYVDGHFDPGMTSAIVEFLGRTGLSGPNDGMDSSEILYGLSYVLTGYWELRGAYFASVSGPNDLDKGVILSAIFHF